MTFQKLQILCLYMLVTFRFLILCHTCSNVLREYENYLATKTPYRIVANRNSSELKYEGCQPIKLWLLVRHGTRNPNAQLIELMKTKLLDIRDLILENVPQATDEIQSSDLDLFQSWSPKLNYKDEKKLTHEGEDEMLLLAERMQNRFPKILDSVYSASSYEFKFTATQRTKRSAQYFATGLFGRQIAKDIDFPEPLKQDPVLRFYKLCNKWRNEISKSPTARIERKKFESSDTMEASIKAINARLGFTDELNFNDVHLMYMVCAFETAWNKRKKSPWCSSFSIDDFKAMEYAEDLKYYWVDGYGYELTYKQACPAIQNMIEFFNSTDALPKSKVYFTHSGTVLKLLAHLELYKDGKHLTAADFKKNSNRKWRVSHIDSFGANLAFVLFDCGGQKKILTLHQEHIIHLPCCLGSDLCDLTKFISYYGGSTECSFNQICDNP